MICIPLKGPLAITDAWRKVQFDPEVAKKAKRRQRQSDVISTRAKEKRGINLRIFKMSYRGMDKLERMSKRSGWTTQQLRIKQAILLDRIASENADHMLEGFRRNGTVPDIAKAEGIEFNSRTEVRLWEKMFGDFYIAFSKNPSVPNAKEIIKTRMWIQKYLTVPKIIHTERGRRWAKLHSVVNNLIKKNVDPEKNLIAEVKKVLNKKMDTESTRKSTITRLRALDLIVAASIYADVVKTKTEFSAPNEYERERIWNHAYSEGMSIIYPLIEKNPELIDTIRNFNSIKPTQN